MSGAAKAIHSYCSTLTWAQGAGRERDRQVEGRRPRRRRAGAGRRAQAAQGRSREAHQEAQRARGQRQGQPPTGWWPSAAGSTPRSGGRTTGVAKSAISPTAWTRENKKWVTDEASHWRQSGRRSSARTPTATGTSEQGRAGRGTATPPPPARRPTGTSSWPSGRATPVRGKRACPISSPAAGSRGSTRRRSRRWA